MWGGQGENASASQVNQLVTYAQSPDKALSDCSSGSAGSRCKTVFYLRPYAIVNGTPSRCLSYPDVNVLAAASESWFAHNTGYTTASYRIYGVDLDGCQMWGMNPSDPGLQAWWHTYLQANADTYDYYLIDMANMDILDEYWYNNGGGCYRWLNVAHFCYSTQEIPTNADMVTAHVNFVNAMTHTNGTPMRFFWQQTYPTRSLSLDLSALATSNQFVGVTCEGCVINKHSTVVPSNYGPYLDTMAAINQTQGAFLMEALGNSPAGSATQILQRSVTIAMMWLGYSQGHTIVQTDLESYNHNLAVWPEDLIYPAGPVQTMVSGNRDIQVTSGVWRREFSTCYQMGHLFGRCAAILNASGSAVTVRSSWLVQAYNHVITLAGGDALSGGTATINSVSFRPNVTTVPAYGALLLAQ